MPTAQARDFALVVGINQYAYPDYLEALNGPKNDVRRFIQWLKSPAGGNVPEGNFVPYLLVSDDVGSRPKWGDIVDAVGKLRDLSRGGETRIGRRLYIFLAGHGVGPDLDDTGLLTVEAKDDRPYYIEGRQCANLFRGQALFE